MRTFTKGYVHPVRAARKGGRPPRSLLEKPAWQEYARLRAGSWVGGYRRAPSRRR